MPSAGGIAALTEASRRTFRERLLDLASEHERLQESCRVLACETEELKSKLTAAGAEQPAELSTLLAENAKLKERCNVFVPKGNTLELVPASAPEQPAQLTDLTVENARLRVQLAELTAENGAAESKSRELQAEVASLSVVVQQLRTTAKVALDRRAKAEAIAEEEMRRAAEARGKAEIDVRAAEEARLVAEYRAKADAKARERAEAQAAQQASLAAAEERAMAVAKVREQAEAQAAEEARQATLKAEQEATQAKVAEEARQVDEAAKMEAQAEAETGRIAEVRARADVDEHVATEAGGGIETTVASEATQSRQATGVHESASLTKTARKEAKPTGEDSPELDRERESVSPGMGRVSRLPTIPWIGNYSHCPTAKARLYVLYNVGGSANDFDKWQDVVRNHFPELELAVLDASTVVQDLDQQVIQSSQYLEQLFHCPFAFIDLSFGARVGVSMIEKLHRARPKKLYIVGQTPPPAETVAVPRKWRVVHPTGKLIKRSANGKIFQIKREHGSEVFVTGKEEKGERGELWVQIDTTRESVKAGWYLTHGCKVMDGDMDQQLLEAAEDDPVPFEVHYSTGDVSAPFEDTSGNQRPMQEWSRLTSASVKFVEYQNHGNNELLLHQDVLRNICKDFIKCFQQRA